MNLYSRIEPTRLLHIIQRKRDIVQGRVDLVDPNELLQIASIRQSKGVTYQPHKHVYKRLPHEGVTQESWCVISGVVQVTLYDIDDTVLHTDVLESGDISITLDEGGHNYLFMADESVIYEYKSGPYYGQEEDKVFIHDKNTTP